jgi:two-component system, LytTR family, response regulator
MRAVIVVADAAQRHALSSLLTGERGVDVVAEFVHSDDALQHLSVSPADVVFLDLGDPDVDAVSFSRQLPADPKPQLVLLADNDHDALLSFEAHAADYVIRPLQRARLARTLLRVESRLGRARLPDNITVLQIDNARPKDAPVEQRIAFRSKGKVTFLRSDEIRFISAEGNYLNVHARNEIQRFRDTISNVERKLDPRTFMRIHRSTIINLHHIREVRSLQTGDAVVILADGTALGISRTYRDAIHRHFGAGMVG